MGSWGFWWHIFNLSAKTMRFNSQIKPRTKVLSFSLCHCTSLAWDEEILHHTWPLLSSQNIFYSVNKSYGFSVGFALLCCQPKVWSDLIHKISVPYCFLQRNFRTKKNKTKLSHADRNISISCKPTGKNKFGVTEIFVGMNHFEMFYFFWPS